jgi:hypothetical protein
MSNADINRAICRYARAHGFFPHTVRVCSVLRFQAIRWWKAEQALRAHQNVT